MTRKAKPTASGVIAEMTDLIELLRPPFSQGKVVLHEPIHVSPRVTAQLGVFSVHPDPTVDFTSKYLEHWIVKCKSIIQLLVDVETLGVTHVALFPGLDGVARQANSDMVSKL